MRTGFQKFVAMLRHAFAVEAPRALVPEDLALLERVANAVVQRRMAGPALMCLESLRPLNYVSSQLMVFLEPLVGSFVATRDYERIAQILEHRESLQVLIDQIEAQDAVRERAGKAGGP